MTPEKHRITSPFKMHGGKTYLAKKFIELFPQGFTTVVEGFFGGGSVMLNIADHVERRFAFDVNPQLILTWQTLQNEGDGITRFLRQCEYTSENFSLAKQHIQDHRGMWDYYSACMYIIRSRFSRGGLCRDFAWSKRLRGDEPGDLHAWKMFVQNMLPRVIEKIQGIHFECIDFCDGCTKHGLTDDFCCLFFADPPYLGSTRSRSCKRLYEYEMSENDHRRLLAFLKQLKGTTFLCGYRSKLYDTLLNGYHNYVFNVPNNAGQGKTKQRREEFLWELKSPMF